MKFSARRLVATITACLLVMLALCVPGCFSPDNEAVIQQTISSEFDTYKNKSDEAIQKVASAAESEGLSELGISGDMLAEPILEGFDYSIDGINVNGDTATAKVTITSKSMSDFEAKFNAAIEGLMDGTGTLTSEEAATTVGDLAMQAFNEAAIIEEEVVLHFELQGNTWVATDVTEVLGATDSIVLQLNTR